MGLFRALGRALRISFLIATTEVSPPSLRPMARDRFPLPFRQVERLAVTVRPNRCSSQFLDHLTRRTPSSPAALRRPPNIGRIQPVGCAISTTGEVLGCGLSPHVGRVARLAPCGHLQHLSWAYQPVSAGCDSPACQHQFISMPINPKSIVSVYSAAAPSKWAVPIFLVSSCSALSLLAEVWLLYPLKHRSEIYHLGT